MRNIAAATALLMLSSFTKAAEIEVIQYDGPTYCDLDESVRPGHYVRVHYIGKIDERSQEGEAGKQFDSTYDRDIPMYFQSGTGQGNPGVDRGVQGLCVGAKATLWIPSVYAYGETGSFDYDIPPFADLHYDVEIVSVAVEPPEKTNLFSSMDLDDSADLSRDEVEAYMEAVIGRKHIPEGFWESQDTDNDGYISWEEFTGSKGDIAPKKPPNAFKIIDVDENGYLTREELEAFALRVHERSVPDSIWAREDKNRDGLISWEEFTGTKGRINLTPP